MTITRSDIEQGIVEARSGGCAICGKPNKGKYILTCSNECAEAAMYGIPEQPRGKEMKTTQAELEALIRQTPLLERLKLASEMIGRMAHDQRPPKMSIPVQPYDEDIFITVTLADAIEAIEGKSQLKSSAHF